MPRTISWLGAVTSKDVGLVITVKLPAKQMRSKEVTVPGQEIVRESGYKQIVLVNQI